MEGEGVGHSGTKVMDPILMRVVEFGELFGEDVDRQVRELQG